MTAVVHLPGCNVKHDGGNWAWTCRTETVITDDRPHIGPEEVARIVLDADGPCSESGSMTVTVEFRIIDDGDLARLRDVVWPQTWQAIEALRPMLADWIQRSQCQHPESEPCP